MRSKSYSGLASVTVKSPDKVKAFLTLSSDYDGQPTESKDYDDHDSNRSYPIQRSSTESRLPLKPKREHYKDLEFRSTEKVEKPKREIVDKGSSTPRLRRKSMSLSDLLSIGRDLTSGRSKNNDSSNTSGSSRRETRAQSESTDTEPAPRKHSRFRLGRSRSRSDHEMKDGIASGPNIDKRKASKLFLAESLMLESSLFGIEYPSKTLRA
ncbi:hypothetical protein QZH41_018308 [Actinostola sp. cb2023]|nr:hypothetical protein QZH41_018308 [Actinostola sp. cb2023]